MSWPLRREKFLHEFIVILPTTCQTPTIQFPCSAYAKLPWKNLLFNSRIDTAAVAEGKELGGIPGGNILCWLWVVDRENISGILELDGKN